MLAWAKRLSAFVLLAAALPAVAKHTSAEVVLDQSTVKPGGSARVAVVFRIDPKWHTYWLNPGDSGSAPRIKWTLPPGVTVTDLEYPIPERKVAEGLTNFIYEDECALLATLHVPTDAKSDFDVQAHVKVVVCSEECIFEEHEVALRVPIGEGKPTNTDRFAAWQQKQPKRGTPEKTIQAEVNGKTGKVTAEVPAGFTAVDLLPPKTRLMKFEAPAITTGGIASTFEVLADVPPDFAGTGLLVLRDSAGRLSGEEVQFNFKFNHSTGGTP